MRNTVLILAVVILAVEGYLVYRFYDRNYLDAPLVTPDPENTLAQAMEDTEADSMEGTVDRSTEDAGSQGAKARDDAKTRDAEEETLAGRLDGEPMLHRATDQNTFGNSTYLDIPGLAGDRNAVVMVKRSGGSGGDADDGHEVGVWFDAYRNGRWAIFNQDREPMPEGSAFDVIVLDGPNGLVHRAGPGNTSGDSTYVDSPLTNGNPDAVLDVTQNWNPGGLGNTYNDHPVGVRYDPARGMWEIRNQDGAALPAGAAFNLAVSNG